MENRVHVSIAAGQAGRSVARQLVQSLLRAKFTQAERHVRQLAEVDTRENARSAQ